MMEFLCEILGKHHDRPRFHCGEPDLDRWFHQQARQDQARRVAAVYIFSPTEEPQRVAGFYTLSATSVHLVDLPPNLVKKLPRYPTVPAFLLGRLARDKDFPGIGEQLLLDALRRAWRHSKDVAAAIILVDAKTKQVGDFYCRYGFLPVVNSVSQFYLPVGSVETLFPH
jgi:predicted GNAT family N-acyltransferase